MSSRRAALCAFILAILAALVPQNPATAATAAEVAMLRLDASSVEIPKALAESPMVAPIRLSLAHLEDPDANRLSLPLPDGQVLRVERTDFERRGRRDYAWRGRMVNAEGQVNGHVTLTVWKNYVIGRIVTPGKLWKIVPEQGRLWLAQAVEPGLPCGTNERSEIASLVMKNTAESAGTTEPAVEAAAFTRLRLVVVYPRDTAGGNPSRLIADVRAAVDDANSVLANGSVNARIELVAVRELDRVENSDPLGDLIFLYDDPAMAALRRQMNAPLLSMITLRSSGVCGIAFLMDRAEYEGRAKPVGVSVLRRGCLDDQVLMHEIGHNLGAQHDELNITHPESMLVPYSKAHFVLGSFRTIMSYTDGCDGGINCPLIDYFSNPNVTFDGRPVGIPGERDNNRLVSETHARFAVPLAPGVACKAGADRLCLLKKRFQVEVSWDNQFNGTSGNGRAVPRTDAAGFFSFGDPSNLELMVKLLDFGNTVKVFWGQLTNLRYRLTITDTKTGEAKTYQNTPGDCGGIDQGAFPGAAAAALDAATLAPVRSAVTPFGAPAREAGCRASSKELCLDNRFTVSVDWRNPGNGSQGQGVAVPFSKVTGAFHFGQATNLELMAKVITQGDRVDFFWGALSDLEYTIHVIDTLTGLTKTYQNAAGRYCGGLEVDAF